MIALGQGRGRTWILTMESCRGGSTAIIRIQVKVGIDYIFYTSGEAEYGS